MDTIILKHGSHTNRDEGMCLLEAVAYIAGEPHTDHPSCTDPVLGAFGRAFNDFMTDDERILLVPLVPRLVGTAGDHTLSLRRAMLLCDGTIRQILPMSFDAIGLSDVADGLRALEPISARIAAESAWSAARSAESARIAAESARSAARSAWSVAESARSAARSAESARIAAESARIAAESAWSAAESARIAAESARIAAESAWSAEGARLEICKAAVAIFTAAIEIK